jgi:hypothetical protein
MTRMINYVRMLSGSISRSKLMVQLAELPATRPSPCIGWTDRSAGCGSERSHFRRHGSLICSRAIYFLVDTSFAFPPTQRQVPEPNDPLQIPSPSNETNSTQHQSDSPFPLWLPFFQPHPVPSISTLFRYINLGYNLQYMSQSIYIIYNIYREIYIYTLYTFPLVSFLSLRCLLLRTFRLVLI